MTNAEADKCIKAEQRPLLLPGETDPKITPEILKVMEAVDKVTKAMQELEWEWVSC
jgi:hypothetical protein